MGTSDTQRCTERTAKVPIPDCNYESTNSASACTDGGIQTLVQTYNKRKSIIQRYGNISDWDTSSVTDMSGLFQDTTFNSDISKWDTSKVTTMQGSTYFSSAPIFIMCY